MNRLIIIAFMCVAVGLTGCELPGAGAGTQFTKGMQTPSSGTSSTSTSSTSSLCPQTACITTVLTQPGLTYVTLVVPGNSRTSPTTYSIWAAINGGKTWTSLGAVTNSATSFEVSFPNLTSGQYQFEVRNSDGSQILSTPSSTYNVLGGSSPSPTSSPTTPAPTISTFSVPATAVYGSPITFNWTTSNATSVAITGINNSSLPVSGTFSTTASASVTYVLTAANAVGMTATKSAAVFVTYPAPVISSFSASQTSIAAGATSTLSWAATAASATFSNLTAGTNISSLVTGSLTVSPTVTTSYKLSAYDKQGAQTVSSTVVVTVIPAPTPSVTPAAISQFQMVTPDIVPTDAALYLRALDSKSNPVPNVSVTLAMSTGKTVVVTTDATGGAYGDFPLPAMGNYQLVASVTSNSSISTTFPITNIVAGQPSKIIFTQPPNNIAQGKTLSATVKVTDFQGNPAPNASIQWMMTTGDSALSTTDSQGLATLSFTALTKDFVRSTD